MTLSKAARQFVVAITTTITVLCQCTALASGCVGSTDVTAGTHCHESAGGDAQGPADAGHSAPCLTQAASSSPALPDVPVPAGMPALHVRTNALEVVADSGLPLFDPPQARGDPPPLTLLYCRLRN